MKKLKLLRMCLLFFSYLTIGIISVKDYIFYRGVLGLLHDWSIPALRTQIQERIISTFYFWDDIVGISKIYPTYLYERILFEFPISVLLNFDGELFSKLLVPILMTIAALTMFYFGKTLKFSDKTAFLMGLFYMLTPVLYNRVIAGHHFYIFAYAIAPLFFSFLHKYINSKRMGYLIASSLILGISAVQLQFLLMLFFMGLLYLFINHSNLNKKNLITSLVVIVFIAILMNSFWIFPNLVNFQTDVMTSTFKGASLDYYEIQHATKTFTAFQMIGYNHNYDPYYLYEQNKLPEFAIYSLISLVIISLSGIIVGIRKNGSRTIALYSLLLIIFGLFFVSAVNGPLPELWKILYRNIPILIIFREVYHSMFIIAFAYTLLIGVFIKGIKKKFKPPIFKKSLFIIILILILSAGYPILNSYMHQLQVLEYNDEDIETYNFLRNDSDIYRVMYIPSLTPIKHPNLEIPSIDLMIEHSPKPTFSQNVRRNSVFESIMQYYIISAIENPEQLKAANALISRLGVKYVICRSNYTSHYPYYIPMQKYLTDVYKNVSLYNNWMNTNLICNNIKSSSEICKKFGDHNIIMINDSMPFISTSSAIVNVLSFSKLLSLTPILDENATMIVIDPMQANSFFMDSNNNNLVLDGNQNLYLCSENTKFILPNTPYYSPDNNWASDLHSWYIHPLITLTPMDSGNVALTWSDPGLETIPDLNRLDSIKNWHFAYKKDVDEWKNYTSENQFNSVYKVLWDKDEKALKTELYNSTWGWKTIGSPLIPVEYGRYYNFAFKVKGEDAHSAQAYIREFDINETLDQKSFLYYPGIADGTFDWKEVTLNYTPENESTRYLQLQIWHGHETDKPLPNIIWVDNTSLYDITDYMKFPALEIPFEVDEADNYELFFHYLKNQKGGVIRVQLDDTSIEIKTKDQLDKFVWKELLISHLEKGKHTLTLENVKGFNAVDSFALISEKEYERSKAEFTKILHNKTLIYMFEAESDLYRENVEISTKFGGEASNGKVLALSSQGIVWQEFEVLKGGYYKIGLHAKGNFVLRIDNSTILINSNNLSFVYTEPTYLSEGVHVIELVPNSVLDSTTWDFVSREYVDEWKNYTSENQFNSVYKILWDKDEKALKTELYNSTWGWKTIRSPLIPVEYGKNYDFSFKVKGENAYSVQAYIREFDENETLDQDSLLFHPYIADGTFDWKEVTLNYTPENESTRYLQLQIWHGHETDKPLPNIVWVKNVSIREYSSASHYLDTIWIYSANSPQSNETVEDLFKVEEKTAEVLSYTKINPTLWKTKINASKPFMLSFAESYDPLWTAYVDGTEYQPVPLYSVINGFWIDKTGDLEIVIKYKPQDWFEIGLLISITTFLSCTGYLLYDWKKGDERIKMIKKKLQELLKRKK